MEVDDRRKAFAGGAGLAGGLGMITAVMAQETKARLSISRKRLAVR